MVDFFNQMVSAHMRALASEKLDHAIQIRK